MRTTIVGSGPAGMASALLLARAGHEVTLVDRDPGPAPGRAWDRVGVMQFHLPHAFRFQSRQLLEQRLPDVYEAVLAAGATLAAPEGAPPEAAMLRIRRSLFERAFWESVDREPRVTRRTGLARHLEVRDGVVVGVHVDGRLHAADLVVDAGGRRASLSAPWRPDAGQVACGMAYAARQYQLRPGAEPGPSNGGPAVASEHDGFLTLLFPHDAGTFTVLVVRPADDRELAGLRDVGAFEEACRLLPVISEWTDPARSTPIDAVRAGAGLVNAFRGQSRSTEGVLAIGDAWCTTNPQGGRGITLGMQSAAALADLVDAAPRDRWAGELDAWGREHLEPWFHDHVAWDHTLLGRWERRPVDPEGPIGIDVLGAAAAVHPELNQWLQPFYGMVVGPAAIEPVRARVREMLRAGWTPPTPGGVTRDDLAAVVRRAVAAA